MKSTVIAAALLGGVILTQGIGHAQQKADFGKRQYDSACAVCHGVKGDGDGPYARIGNARISDITTLAKRNNGMFPFQRVFEIIDGTEPLKAHGTRDMPIWGREYRIQAGEVNFEVPYDPEAYVRTRILALTEYVSRLQVK
jgi:mono/diheme cytochrome c family protein